MTAIVSNEGPSPANRDGLYARLANKLVSAANGVDYAYRDTGPGASGGSTTRNLPLTSKPSSATLINWHGLRLLSRRWPRQGAIRDGTYRRADRR